ncbi:MAG: pyridoxamine 5'-phosphate oxidase family protein [Candidatus Promineofilum sp.]|nr:pyridoxamine 5'-phosphate oxidase family protein [Promineifilum sp.]MCW5861885.1 pyridoxamine 5'-phosphate oxidase family protein [Anaerolineae bacterium]
MAQQLSAQQVWQIIDKELFAVVGMVNARNEARTAGILYAVRDHKLYFITGRDTWKVRHIAANPHVSVTIPIAKRVPIMPWMKIPQATITFQGTAHVCGAGEAMPDLLQKLLGPMANDKELIAGSCLIEIVPEGEFVTYGIGVRLIEMRDPNKARGRAPVN